MDYLNQHWNDILSPLNNGSSSNNTSSNELFMNKGKNIVDDDVDIEDEEAIPLYNRGSSNVNNNENDFEVNENNDFELEHAKYDDFSTIDWLRDIMKEKTGKKRKINKNSLNQYIISIIDASQSWIIVFFVGILSGIVAAFVAISAQWLTDIKLGYCPSNWYLNRRFCCLKVEDKVNHSCSRWVNWSQALFNNPDYGFFNWLIYVFFAGLFAFISSYLVVHVGPYSAMSGVAEIKTILGGFIIKQFLGTKTLIVKCISLPLALGSGLILGKEGSMVHIACCIGNIFTKYFSRFKKNEAKKREIYSAACAAGISVAFGAPIGGVLFSLEEMSSYFPVKTMWRSFFCSMVAVFFFQFMNPFRGKTVLFQATYDRDWHFFEVLSFLIIGVFGGVFGSLFIRLNIRAQAYRRSTFLKYIRIIEATIVAFITAAFSYFIIYMRMDESELLEILFKECEEGDHYGICQHSKKICILLLITMVGKAFFTVLTYGVSVPGGVFIPSMTVGACFGRVLGIIMQYFQQNYPSFPLFSSCHPDKVCITPGMYALLGAMASLGGVTRMTISIVVIMFELTGTLNYIVPCMISLMTAKFVGDAFGKGGIDHMIIRLRNYPYLDQKEEYYIGKQAKDIMVVKDDLITIKSTDATIGYLKKILNETEYQGYPIIDDEEYVTGYITRSDLKTGLERNLLVNDNSVCRFGDIKITANSSSNANSNQDTQTEFRNIDFRPYFDATPICVDENVTAEFILDLFKKLGSRCILVVRHDKLRGIITKKDILKNIEALDSKYFDSIIGIHRRNQEVSGDKNYTIKEIGRAHV